MSRSTSDCGDTSLCQLLRGRRVAARGWSGVGHLLLVMIVLHGLAGVQHAGDGRQSVSLGLRIRGSLKSHRSAQW